MKNIEGKLMHLAAALLVVIFILSLTPRNGGQGDTRPEETAAPYEFRGPTERPSEPPTEPQTEPPTEPQTELQTEPQTEPPVDEGMVEMLAILIYQEAGGDACCDDCRRRVADVALNRVADPRFPNTLECVMTAPRQYGRLHWTGIRWAERAKNPGEAHAVERARRIAREVLQGQHSELYGQGYIWQAGFHQGKDEIYHCGHWFGR